MPRREPFPCPSCGEEVTAGAKACPSCGADENTGWSENTNYDGVDIPNPDEMDYDEILEKEGLATPKRSGRRIARRVIAVIVLGVIVLVWILR